MRIQKGGYDSYRRKSKPTRKTQTKRRKGRILLSPENDEENFYHDYQANSTTHNTCTSENNKRQTDDNRYTRNCSYNTQDNSDNQNERSHDIRRCQDNGWYNIYNRRNIRLAYTLTVFPVHYVSFFSIGFRLKESCVVRLPFRLSVTIQVGGLVSWPKPRFRILCPQKTSSLPKIHPFYRGNN